MPCKPRSTSPGQWPVDALSTLTSLDLHPITGKNRKTTAQGRTSKSASTRRTPATCLPTVARSPDLEADHIAAVRDCRLWDYVCALSAAGEAD